MESAPILYKGGTLILKKRFRPAEILETVERYRVTVLELEVGEIIVRGPTWMSGYWNRPDLTAETVRDGWLHTGDLAKKDEPGYIYLGDRLKEMFISGGEDVYPVEIEKVLLSHLKISDVAVIGIPDEKWGEVGKAYIVLKPLLFLQGKIGRFKTPFSRLSVGGFHGGSSFPVGL